MKLIITATLAVIGFALTSCSDAGSIGSNAANGAVDGAIKSVTAPANPTNAISGAAADAIAPASNVTTPTIGNLLSR